MTSDIYQLAINSSGAAIVTALFIWYLLKLAKTNDIKDDRYNRIIQEYLKENLNTHKELAKNLQEFADASRYNSEIQKEQTEVIKNQKEVLEHVYKELVKRKKKIDIYETTKTTRVDS